MALLELMAAPAPLTFRQVGRWLLALIAFPFVAVGWCVGKVVRTIQLILFGLGYSVAWLFAAVRVGYQSGAGRRVAD